jgi:hypothetical protein
LQSVFIDGRTIESLPAFLAYAVSFDAEAVAVASRMWTIGFGAELSFITLDAGTFSIYALPVTVAIGNFALVVP